MSIQGIRFRTEGALIVLQVQEYTEGRGGSYHYGSEAVVAWRDAKVEDMLEVSRFTFDPARHDKRLESLEQRIEYVQAESMHRREPA